MYGLYLGTVVFAATLLFRGIGMSVFEAAAPVEVTQARKELTCEDLAATLHKELWAWFFADIQALGPDTHRRGPLPGALREWETLRQLGADRCDANKTRDQFAHLLALRRALESQSYLLSATAGADIAALR